MNPKSKKSIFFGRQFHSKYLKNEQIEIVGPTFFNALYVLIITEITDMKRRHSMASQYSVGNQNCNQGYKVNTKDYAKPRSSMVLVGNRV